MKMSRSSLRNEKGFTLIEMAIVLVIIGLILGAVIKGKDVLNSAKQKKFYTNSIKEWELALASYYDRTGNVLGDGAGNGGLGTKDGRFDNVSGATFKAKDGIDYRLKAVGLSVPTSNTADSGVYTYSGTYSGSQTINLWLYDLTSHTDGGSRNTLYFENMPTDLAIALDTIIDGEANSKTGNFRRYEDTLGAGIWPSAETTKIVNVSYTINLP